MATQRSSKPKKPAVKPDKASKTPREKINVKTKTAPKPAKVREITRPILSQPLTEIQKALRIAKAQVKRERQARMRAEATLTEAQRMLAVDQLQVEPEPRSHVKHVSFVVRLTVDEHSQPARTEIEHVSSSKKQKFLTLDGERLVAFIRTCLNPITVPEHPIYPASSPKKVYSPSTSLSRPKALLVVSNVIVSHPGDLGCALFTLTSGEPFVVQACFQLVGPEALALTDQEPSYEMRVYVYEVMTGNSRLLINCREKLIPKILEYIAPAEVPELLPGLYHLFTIIILGAPIKIAGYRGRTTLYVN